MSLMYLWCKKLLFLDQDLTLAPAAFIENVMTSSRFGMCEAGISLPADLIGAHTHPAPID